MNKLEKLTFVELEALRQYYKDKLPQNSPATGKAIEANLEASNKYEMICKAIEAKVNLLLKPDSLKAGDIKNV